MKNYEKLLSCLLTLAMLVSVAVPMAYAEGEPGTETGTETEVTTVAPEFPEDAALTAKSANNNIGLVFPNTAVDAEGNVAPAHKIVLRASDSQLNNVIYSKVHAVESGAVTTETEYSLTRVITVPVYRGNFSAEVYPMSTTDEATAVLGTPLTANFTLTEREISHGSIRLEFEDYVSPANQKAAETVCYASGGKLYASHNGFDAGENMRWFKSANFIARTADADLSFEVNLPYSCNYTIDTVMHYVPTPTNVGLMEVFVDGKPISSSKDSPTSDLSINGSYPWKHMPLKLFRDKDIYLEAGPHTIDVKMTVATNTAQPQHFAADYIQFTPELETVSNATDSWIEFEDYVGKGITDNGKGTDTTTTNYYPGPVAHGGAALHTDSYSSGDAGYDVLINVPLYVESEGVYSFEYVTAKTGKGTKLYLNESDITAFYENTLTPFFTASSGTALSDPKDPLTGKYTYFNAAHHSAQKFTSSVYLPAGENTITVEILCRASNAGGTAATCLDYLKLTPVNPVAVISAEGETRLELEDYPKNIIYDSVEIDDKREPVLDENGEQIYTGTHTYTATVQHDDWSIGIASGDKILDMSERVGLTGPSTHFIPVTAVKAGWYDVSWVATNSTNNNHLSVVKLCVDGKPIMQNNKNAVADGISYRASQYYPMGEFRAQVYLTEGDHMVTMNAAQIVTYTNNAYGIKYMGDFLAFTPAEITEGVTLDDSTKTATASVAFDGPFTGKAIIAAYAGKELVGVAETDITDKGVFTTSVNYTATPDTVKVFIWEDMAGVQPLTGNKIFEIK